MRVRGIAAGVALCLVAAQTHAAKPEAARRLKSIGAAASVATWVEMHRLTFGNVPRATSTDVLSDVLGLEDSWLIGGDGKAVQYVPGAEGGAYEIRAEGRTLIRNGELVTPYTATLEELGVSSDDLSAAVEQSLAERTMREMRRLASALEAHQIDHGKFPSPAPAVTDAWRTPLRVEITSDGKRYSIIGADRKFDPATRRREAHDFSADAVLADGELTHGWAFSDLSAALLTARMMLDDLEDVRQNGSKERARLANTLHNHRISRYSSTDRPRHALVAYETARKRNELTEPLDSLRAATARVDDDTEPQELMGFLSKLETVIGEEIAALPSSAADEELAQRMDVVPLVASSYPMLHRFSQHPHAGPATRARFKKLVERGVARGLVDDETILTAAGVKAPPLQLLRVGGTVSAPLVLLRSDPEIPEAARAAKVTGVVLVEATIDDRGRVIATRTIRSLRPDVDAAAEAAVKRWTFRPAMQHGQGVAVVYTVPVNIK